MKKNLTGKISILAATALTLGTCLPAGIAFADPDPETPPVPPSVGNQSGAGSTALTMVWENANAEYGGTEYQTGDYANPDGSDDDEWGDNLAFSAPSAINFVAQANGNLLAPQSNIDIVNHSTYGVRVSSMKLDANTTDGWNIVANAEAAASTQNAVWGEIGVTNDMLNWASYTSAKANVTKAYEWNMNADGNAGSSLPLSTSGSFTNLNINLNTAQTFGTIHWYLKAGNADGPVSITNGTVSNGTFVVGTSNDATENELLFAGDTAHVVTTPATGYKLASVTVVENGTSNVISATVEGNNATFTMPAGSVTVTPVFEKINYNMLSNTVSNGTFFMARNVNAISADSTAQYGDDVFIISEPDTGYELSEATVTGDVSGDDIETTLIGDNKAQFTMPAEPVSTEVEFEKADYSILTPAATGGTYIVDSNSIPANNISTAQCGDTVYVGVSPATGYEASVVVRGATSGVDTNVSLTNNIGSFSMPAENITVLVAFTKIDYAISTSAASNGTFVVSKNTSGSPAASSANCNDTVYVVTTPDTGCQIESMLVVEADTNTPVTVTRSVGGNDNIGSFTMPASGVTVSVRFTIPAKAHVNMYTMDELQTISADIRANGTSSTYYSSFNAFAKAGENVTATMHDGTTTKNATLVDASAGYGLVFMLDKIGNAKMNSERTNAGGWTGSTMRASLRAGGTLYNSYLDGMTMSLADASDQLVVPASVTTYSADHNASSIRQQTTVGDTFFLASISEIYGHDGQPQYLATQSKELETNCHQFAYFANLGVSASNYAPLRYDNGFTKAGSSSSAWWLRSTEARADGIVDYYFWRIESTGTPRDEYADYNNPVLPCFCLAGPEVPVRKTAAANGSFIVGTSASSSSDSAIIHEGESAYVLPTPASGYEVNTVGVTDTASGAAVTVTKDGGVHRFAMPAGGATVVVTFRPTISATYSMSQLQAISADIRENGTNSPYYSTFDAYARDGEVVSVKLANNSVSHATLVDASEGYGLVFMLDNIANTMMHSSQTTDGGWAGTAMRTSLRSGGTLYNSYLNGMTMSLTDASDQLVVPANVTTYSSDYNSGSPQQQTTTGETFFLASVTEVYGDTPQRVIATYGSNYEPDAHQFAYFANLGVTGTCYWELDNARGFTKAAGSSWWLRSVHTQYSSYFWSGARNGRPNSTVTTYSNAVLPCFCL